MNFRSKVVAIACLLTRISGNYVLAHLSVLGLVVTLMFASSSAKAATFTWAGVGPGVTWGTTGNFTPTPTFNNTTDLAFFSTFPVTINDSYLGAARTVRSLNFGDNVDSNFTVTFRDGTTSTSRNLTLNDSGSGPVSIRVASGAIGNITLGAATVAENGTVGNIVLAQNLVIDHKGSGNLLINRSIIGTGGFTITKTGTGRWIQGTAAATSGTNNDFNSAAAITLDGGALEVLVPSALPLTKTFSVPLTVNSASTLAYNNQDTGNSRVLTLDGTASGSLTLNAELTIQNLSAGSTTLNNGVNISRVITGSGKMIVSTGNDFSTGANSGLRRVALSGNNLTTGAGSWSGGIWVKDGSVAINPSATAPTPAGGGSIEIGTTASALSAAVIQGNADQAGFTAFTIANPVFVRSGGTRLFRNNGGFSYDITFTGTVQLDSGATFTVDHSVGVGRSVAFGGKISGGGGLEIVRTGGAAGSRVTISNGANDYTGNTNVFSGMLLLENSGGSATGAGDITVNTGATLGGNGRATGAATVNGFLTPGTGVGDLELGSLTMAATSQLTLELDAIANTADAVITQGSVSIAPGAALQLSFVAVSPGPYADTFVVVNNRSTAGTTGTFNTLPSVGGLLQYTVNYGVNYDGDGQNNDITITFTSVPEPGTVGPVAVAGMGFLRRRRNSSVPAKR